MRKPTKKKVKEKKRREKSIINISLNLFVVDKVMHSECVDVFACLPGGKYCTQNKIAHTNQ